MSLNNNVHPQFNPVHEKDGDTSFHIVKRGYTTTTLLSGTKKLIILLERKDPMWLKVYNHLNWAIPKNVDIYTLYNNPSKENNVTDIVQNHYQSQLKYFT